MKETVSINDVGEDIVKQVIFCVMIASSLVFGALVPGAFAYWSITRTDAFVESLKPYFGKLAETGDIVEVTRQFHSIVVHADIDGIWLTSLDGRGIITSVGGDHDAALDPIVFLLRPGQRRIAWRSHRPLALSSFDLGNGLSVVTAVVLPIGLASGSVLTAIFLTLRLRIYLRRRMSHLVSQLTLPLTGFAKLIQTTDFGDHQVSLKPQKWAYRELNFLQDTLAESYRLLYHAQDQLRSKAALAAIGRATQMLAHDMKRPFSTIRLATLRLEGARDFSEMKKILSTIGPEINRNIVNVEGMIHDVMEIGSPKPSELLAEAVSPIDMLREALTDVFQAHPKADVVVHSSFSHVSLLKVDRRKVSRLLANILDNAVQAMGEKGTIWLETSEFLGYHEIRIGNDRSFIESENLEKLFDAFYTSNKKDGTGLGLAIAQKVVMDHGGNIHCSSLRNEEFPSGKVEFTFTLPVDQTRQETRLSILPKHSTAYALTADEDEFAGCESTCSDDRLLVADDSETINSKKRPEIAVLDDNVFMLEGWEHFLSRDAVVHSSESPEDFRRKLLLDPELLNRLDLVITDFHFDGAKENGLELGRFLKNTHKELPVFLCSDANFDKMSLKGVVDAVIEKTPKSLAVLMGTCTFQVPLGSIEL